MFKKSFKNLFFILIFSGCNNAKAPELNFSKNKNMEATECSFSQNNTIECKNGKSFTVPESLALSAEIKKCPSYISEEKVEVSCENGFAFVFIFSSNLLDKSHGRCPQKSEFHICQSGASYQITSTIKIKNKKDETEKDETTSTEVLVEENKETLSSPEEVLNPVVVVSSSSEETDNDPSSDDDENTTDEEEVTEEPEVINYGLVGLVYKISTSQETLPDFSSLTPDETIIVSEIVMNNNSNDDFFGLSAATYGEFTAIKMIGKIKVPSCTGNCIYRLTSDDGSKLIINGDLIINNDGYHGAQAVTGAVSLAAGSYDIELEYFQGPGEKACILEISVDSGSSWNVVDSQSLTH